MFSWLVAWFIVAIGIIISHTLTNHLPAHQITASSVEAITNLAYGFAASCIFYYINVYIPSQRKIDSNARQIASTLSELRSTLSNALKNVSECSFEEVNGMMNTYPYYADISLKLYKISLQLADDSSVRTIILNELHNSFEPQYILEKNIQNKLYLQKLDYQKKIEAIDKLFEELKNIRKKSKLADKILSYLTYEGKSENYL